jgi:putative ABC transport system permease protein
MNRALLLQMAWVRLGRYKAKTLVLGIGIVISVLATALIESAGVHFMAAAKDFNVRTYPAGNLLLVGGSGAMGGGAQRNGLKLADVEAVLAAIPAIVSWDPYLRGGARDLKQGDRSVSVGVSGYSERAENVRSRGVGEGDFISAQDVQGRASVALLGATTARKLFGDQSPLGQTLFIGTQPFQVKGVLEKAGMDPHGYDLDDAVYVPFTTLMERVLHVNEITAASFVVADAEQAEAVAARMAGVMRERHHIEAGQQDDFSIITASQMRKQLKRAFTIFDVFIPLIAGTAFLISGLVLMSIMLTSIRERTAEFGLRRALGARASDVRFQVLMEVVFVVAIASLVGLVLAKAIAIWLAPVLHARVGVKQFDLLPGSMALGVAGALLTGALGALLPAGRAARLNPVTALN